jgi:putative nucleotidyltransferase with HDIG domain
MKSIVDNILSNSLRKNKNYSVLILFILVFSLVTMYPVGKSIGYNYSLDAAWTSNNLIADFSFPIYKDKSEYNNDIEKAKRDFVPIFRTYNTHIDYDSIRVFFNSLNNAILYKIGKNNNSSKAISFINSYTEIFSSTDWDTLILLKQNESSNKRDFLNLKSLEAAFLDLQLNINGILILSVEKTEINSENIAIRENNIEKIYSTNLFFDETEIYEMLNGKLSANFSDYGKYVVLTEKIFHIIYEPNLIYDKEASDYEIELLVKSVPKTLGIVKENETIISTNEKVTAEAKIKIESYVRAKSERMSNINIVLQYIGKSLNTLIMLFFLIIYLYLFRKKIFDDNLMLLLMAILILFVSSLAYLTTQFDTNLPIEYLIILPVSAMLITIIFDSRIGFYNVVTTALIISAIRGIDYSLFLSSVMAGSLAVYTVRDIKNRNQIFRSVLYIMLGYSISIISIGLESFDDYRIILDRLIFAGINSVLSPVLTFGFLIFFEKIFNISTDITLLELSDFNHPLLKELSTKAPGTFHHSVLIGSLVEAGAESINANSLLARVGAYYHDIGKMLKPEYFIENQTSGKNKHDKLSPNMSTLIIISHIKEGVELAKKYNLPQSVIDFIQMHHGTTLVTYFYDKALRKRRAYREMVREIDFRYPGPKPSTKEIAIVMLADSIEASVRAMIEPTLPQMEGLIDSIVRTRLQEGELDECNLTMLDIASIKKSFLKIFVGIYHKRIKYPEKIEPNKQ